MVAFAQDPPAPAKVQPTKAAGNYEGTVKGQIEKVALQVKLEVPNVVGRVQVADKTYEITGGSLSDEDLNLEFKGGRLDGKVNGDTLTGELRIGSEKKQIELKRVPATAATAATAATPATPATPAAAAAPVNLNGDWEAVADANGQPFPFLLTLKIDGEKVTGGSSSQLGEGTIKEGSWKDGKLTFQIEGTNGTIAMSATVIDGKLSGEFDYAGQLSGKWVAVRKNP
jgi:hypothetical protein